MKNTQLFELLGEIDDKFYDEALGGDSEKALKIDTSARRPLKWYRIAAPIAACLVLGAGIFTVSRFLDRSGVVKPPITSDDPINHGFVSANEADLDACKQLLLEKYSDISSFSTRIMDINFDGIDEAVVRPYGGDSIVHIFSKYNGEMTETGYIDTEPYEYCIGDLSELKEYDPSDHLEAGNRYWCFHFKTENKDAKMLAEAVARINYNGSPSYTIDFPVAAYSTGYTGASIDNLTLKKNWQYSYNFQGSGIESGTDISRNEFASLWDKHIPYEELDAAFIEYLDKNDPFKHNMKEFYPDLDLGKIPMTDSSTLSDGTPVDPGSLSPIRRAQITGTTLYDVDTYKRIFVSLVGENIYTTTADNSNNYMYMDKMSVIMFQRDFEKPHSDDQDTLISVVDLDPIPAGNSGGSRGNMMVRQSYYTLESGFKLYHLDDIDIIAIGGGDYIRSDSANCNFVGVTKEGKLILLKGTGLNGDTVSPYVSTSNRLVVSGNSLLDFQNGVEFRFSPEMFEYAATDADHAHFKCTTLSPSEIPDVKGGYVYGLGPEHPQMETHGSIQGTQEDLDRWYNFIASVKPAVIHAGGMEEDTFDLHDENAAELFSIVKGSKFTLLREDDFPNPSGFPDWVVGCDSDGNALFDVYYNGETVSVSFDDSGKYYRFDAKKSSIEQISGYMYDHNIY
ncbi:MAG: hypothetical protein K2N56_12065 [Oscillospiraceae bacterium]|nr:hypothetical protein [Oscillospiraceae bacterium]